MSRRKIKAGSTSVTVPVFVQDTSSTTGAGLGSLVYNTSGLAAKYRREGQSSWTTISLVTATVGTWTSGGFVADGGPVTGGYEVGIPDAALAAGAKWAEVTYYGAANMLPVLLEFELDAVDYQDATRFGLTALPSHVAKNTALNNFTFPLRASADHVTLKTGLTVTAQRSLDGGAYGACANAVSEIGTAGVYKINLAASDLNADVVGLLFTASGADPLPITIVTQP